MEPPNFQAQALETMVRASWFAAVPGLVDSLIHDARNPLNALTLNLEVLTEKIHALPNSLPAADKNLRAIREQVFRVDSILRKFAEFIAARPAGQGEANLSELVVRAVEVLGHEARSGRVRMLSQIEPGLKVRFAELSAAPFVALQP
ncbi:MAG TPA: histidine kinase, partial [Myxococcaceae bacterium]|nr:histidine kinase [Myxococcaceae bacterium]